MFDGGAECGEIGGIRLDQGEARREIDRGTPYSLNRAEGALDTIDAAGTAHAGDFQRNGLGFSHIVSVRFGFP